MINVTIEGGLTCREVLQKLFYEHASLQRAVEAKVLEEGVAEHTVKEPKEAEEVEGDRWRGRAKGSGGSRGSAATPEDVR